MYWEKMISMKKDLIDILAPGSIRESAQITHIIERPNTQKSLVFLESHHLNKPFMTLMNTSTSN